MKNISEPIGKHKAIELDPETGTITLLDSESGFVLNAAEVLVMTGFLSQYEELIGLSAFLQIDACAGDDVVELKEV